MSLTRHETVECRCGAPIQVFVADSLNAERHPHLRQALLDRRLHVFVCERCAHQLIVENELVYLDMERRQFLGVFPWRDRARERACAEKVMRAYQVALHEKAPRAVAEWGQGFLVRVCFGLEEAREKLVADDAGLADLALEALKCRVLAAEPRFQQQQVITLRLDEVAPDGTLRFVPEVAGRASWLDPTQLVEVERRLYDEVYAGYDGILARHPGMASGPHVSLLRLLDWSQAG